MRTGKKVLNVFGIIIAWILSIILVLLFVTPIVLSAVSLVTPKNLMETAKDIALRDVATLFADETSDLQDRARDRFTADQRGTGALRCLY